MSVSNVSSKWVDGNLVFFKKETGESLVTLNASDASVVVSGLELETKSAYQADLVDVSGTVSDSDLNTVIAAVNELKTALVSAGIMADE